MSHCQLNRGLFFFNPALGLLSFPLPPHPPLHRQDPRLLPEELAHVGESGDWPVAVQTMVMEQKWTEVSAGSCNIASLGVVSTSAT